MITKEKPGTPAELVHAGVLGMKWGVRKSQSTIDFNKKFPTGKKRDNEINRARVSQLSSRQKWKAESNPKKKQQLKDLHLKNPDRATSMRLLRGEKVVFALLAAVPTSTIPVAIGIPIRVGRRRMIEP